MAAKKSLSSFVVFLSVFFILAALPLSGDGNKPETEKGKIVLQLKWFYQFQFAGYIAAYEQGFYEEEGLDVEIREGGPGITPSDEVNAGNAHFGVENSEVLLYRLQGRPVVALAAIVQHSPLVLLARKDSPYKTPHDLAGSSIMMGEGLADLELAAMFQNEGISLDSIEQLGYTLDPEVFLDPEIAAIAAYATNTPFLLEQEGIEYNVISPISYGIDFYSDVLFTDEELIETDPDLVAAFRRASLKGWKYTMENPAEVADVLKKKYGAEKSFSHLIYEAGAMEERMLPELVELGHMSPSRWRRIADTFVALGMVGPDYSLDGFLFDEYLEPDIRLWRRAGIVIAAVFAGIFFTAFILLIYNRNLRKAVGERTRELSRLNEDLHEKERDLSRAQNVSRVGSWRFIVETGMMLVSEEMRRIFELPEGPISFEMVMERIDPAYQGLVRTINDDLIETGEYAEIDYRIITPGGVDKIIRGIGEGMRDENGNLVQLYGTVQDITEQKLIEDQLQIQRDLAVGVGSAESLMDAAALSVFGAMELTNTDIAGLFIYEKEKKEVRLIYSEGISDGFKEAAAVLPHDTYFWRSLSENSVVEVFEDQKDLQKLNEITGEGIKFSLFFPLVYRGKIFGAVGIASRSRDSLHLFEKQALSDLMAQISNVIWQKKTEEALRVSENRYRRLYESLMYGVNQTTNDGFFQEANKAFQEMVGYSQEELRNLTFKDITPEKWWETETKLVTEQLHTKGYTDEFEKEFRRKDGTLVPVSLRIWENETEQEGETEYWAVVQDISERKESERLITKAMDELARSNEELKQFAYVASHDLQEPLRAMTGFSELLKERYLDNLDEGAREFIDFIIDAAGRMQQLINALLSYSRANTRQHPFVNVDLNEVVETVKLNLTAKIKESGASISSENLPTVLCDKQQIVQLFQNLISNGLKYQAPGRAPVIQIASEEFPAYYRIRVQDNGIGMKKDFLEVIFQMFQRLHTKDEYDGTGIGLALCKKIVDRHNGKIWAESEENKGSVFYVTLPKTPRESEDEKVTE